MAYVKTTWNDRIVAKPMTFTLQNNGDGTTTLVSAEGAITQAGTPLNSLNLNHLETQYDQAMADVATTYLKLIGGSLTGALSIESGAGVTPLSLINDNGQILIINDTTENSLQSLIANGTASRPFTIEGLNGANLTNFNIKADNSIFSGQIVANRGTQNFIAKGTAIGNANNAYYEVADSAGTRAGFFGKTSAVSATMAVWSDIGDIVLRGTTNANLNIGSTTILNTNSAGVSITGTLATTSTISVISGSAGSTLAQFKNSVDDGYLRIVSSATANFIQSGNNAFTASKNLTISGINATALTLLTLNATSVTATGTIATGGATLSNSGATQQNAILSANVGGVYLRPNGIASTTGEFSVSTAGNTLTNGNALVTGTISESGSLLTAKYAQLATANTFTGYQTITVTGATANAFSVKNTTDDGHIRIITTAGTNFLQSGLASAGSPKNFTINGMSSTIIPTFTVGATSSVFSGTIQGTTINATTDFQIAGTPLANVFLDKTATGTHILNGNLTAPTINGSTVLQEAGTSLSGKYVRLDGSNTMTGTLTAPIVNGSTKLQEAGVDLASKYMPLVPSIVQMSDGATAQRTAIATKTGDVNGFGILIGCGGLSVLGGGESANAILNDVTFTGGTEQAIVSADNHVRIFSNCQTYANKHELLFDTSARLSINGDVVASALRGNNLWTGSSIFVGSTVIPLGMNIADCPNGIMLEWRQTSGTAFLHLEPVYKNYAQDSVCHINAGYNSPATYCGKNVTITGGGTSITGSDTNNTGVMANRTLTRIYAF